MEKDFDGWNTIKKAVDSRGRFRHPKEREIWWCRIGINVGSEVCGKGKEFTRPVLIINSESSKSCIGIPLSSKIKKVRYSCTVRTDDAKLHLALVFQLKNIDKRRCREKMYTLSKDQYEKVKNIFDTLYKI